MIELQTVSAGYGGRPVLENVTLALRPGRVLALLGPNGCGKSTLLRTVAGLMPRLSGEILVDGVPADRLTSRQLARKLAYMPQSRSVPNILAWKMVLHGRFPYLAYPRHYRPEDRAAAWDALRQADAEELVDRPVPLLSGGQRQKVYLAMALAQDTDTVLMDEPTTFLDIRHQLEVMDIARHLADQGRAAVLVLHDICLALRFADELAVLNNGRLQIWGPPEEVYRSGVLNQSFGVRLRRFSADGSWQYYYA